MTEPGQPNVTGGVSQSDSTSSSGAMHAPTAGRDIIYNGIGAAPVAWPAWVGRLPERADEYVSRPVVEDTFGSENLSQDVDPSLSLNP